MSVAFSCGPMPAYHFAQSAAKPLPGCMLLHSMLLHPFRALKTLHRLEWQTREAKTPPENIEPLPVTTIAFTCMTP